MDNISKIIFDEAIKAFKKKKYNQVLALVAKLIGRGSTNIIVFYLKAFSLYQLNEINESIPLLQEIVQQNKKFEITVKSAILLGYIYTKKKEYAKAKNYLTVPLRKNYENHFVYSILGYIAHEEEDYKQAEEFFQKSLDRQPNNPTHNNNMGYNYLIWQKNHQLAARYIEKAFDKDKENINYIHSVGWLYFVSKNFKKSKEMLKKALSLKSNYLIKKHYEEAVRQVND